jgi:hypothetical protein
LHHTLREAFTVAGMTEIRIAELAASTGLTVRALRYCKELELLMPDRSTAAIACAEVLALEVQTPTCGWLLSDRRRAAGWPHDLPSRGASRHESRGTPVAVDVAQAEAGVSAEQARDAIRRYSGRRTSTSARATDSTAPTMAVSINPSATDRAKCRQGRSAYER